VRGLALLEQALASDIGPSVRRAAARGLGQLRCDGLPAQGRHEVQDRALAALEAAAADGEWVVRYAVVVGLESLSGSLERGSGGQQRAVASLRMLEDPEEAVPVVRLRARQALAALAG